MIEQSSAQEEEMMLSLCFIQLFLIYTMLSEFEQLLRCMTPCVERQVSSHSSSPLSLLLYCTIVCERLRSDVGAQAALGEHADSALISKNRWNASTGAALEEERREYDAWSAAQKWLVGDVSTVKTPSSSSVY